MQNDYLDFLCCLRPTAAVETLLDASSALVRWLLALVVLTVPLLLSAAPQCHIYADMCVNNSPQNGSIPLRTWFPDTYRPSADATDCAQRALDYAHWCGNNPLWTSLLQRDPSGGLATPSLGRVASYFGDRPPSNERIFPQPPNAETATPLQDAYSSAGQYLTDAAGRVLNSAPNGCLIEATSCRYPGAPQPLDFAWYDDWGGSAATSERCMARANDYAAWCKTAQIPPAPKPQAVRVRHWTNGTVRAESVVQDVPPLPATSVCITRVDGTRTRIDNVPILRGSGNTVSGEAVLVERDAVYALTQSNQNVFVERGGYVNGMGRNQRIYVAGGATADLGGSVGSRVFVKNGGKVLCSASSSASPVVEAGALTSTCNVAPIPVERTATFERCDPTTPWPVTRMPLNDTAQGACYNNNTQIPCPPRGMPFAGQDAQFGPTGLSLRDNGNGTISDLRTGLMWPKAQGDRVTWDQALMGAKDFRLGGYNDWRLPNIKELYSLIKFDGVFDTRDLNQSGASVPFIDTTKFQFSYLAGSGNLRFFDNQVWSSTKYIATTSGNDNSVFGVNFADGRIKSYPIRLLAQGNVPNTQFVRYVRGNPGYGSNSFDDLGNGTIIDYSTGLQWQKADSGATPIDWQTALGYCDRLQFAGFDDWRLPNAKELQSIVDYTRAPATSGTPAINPIFSTSNSEPYYWTSTTLLEVSPVASTGSEAIYIAFGRAMGFLEIPPGTPPQPFDVHGAGAQRSDPKTGIPVLAPPGRGPQGDDVRIRNFARCVRGNGA